MVIWGDVAYRKDVFFSPDYWRKYYKPGLKAMVDVCHENGLPVILFRPAAALEAPSPAVLRLHLAAGDQACLAVVKSRGGRPARLPIRDLFDQVHA